MSSDKLALNQHTSINDVNSYFENLDPDKKVRARKIGGGQIELYVRKDSFKQFFTDKLRPDFLVKRDYQEARKLILEKVNQSAPENGKLTCLLNIKENFANHKSHFYPRELRQEFENLSQFLEKQAGAKEAIESIKGKIMDGNAKYQDLQTFQDYVINHQAFLELNLNEDETKEQSKHLFNLDKAKNEIRKANLVYIVEGYFDAIILSQQGIKNVVATCGTALSEHHLALLYRYCENIVLMLDGDNAGMLASEKMLEKIKSNEMTGYRLVLPDNYDPDIFILEFGLDVFNQIADQLMQNESKILKIKL